LSVVIDILGLPAQSGPCGAKLCTIGVIGIEASFNIGILLEFPVQLLQQIEASGEYVDEALALSIPQLSPGQEKLYVIENDRKASHSAL
jgi:hypothetical protein